MFTGIIEETGKIINIRPGPKASTLTISGKIIFDDLKLGDSVAVNGVCLTVSSIKGNCFEAEAVSETLARTSLKAARAGSPVNLERALPAYGRFGGHIVSGHIDGTGKITKIERDGRAIIFSVETTAEISRYIIKKGSIAMDGISLTVANIKGNTFQVFVIPHTAENTTLIDKSPGDILNLENDIIGKYIEKLFKTPEKEREKGVITEEFLSRAGF